MSKVSGQIPFEDYWVYKPTLSKKEGRLVVALVHKTNSTRTSMSYARYLLSIQLGRKLNADEQVDHINENRLDDRLENLQILSPLENKLKYHVSKGTKKRFLVIKCPECGRVFEKSRNQTHVVKGGTYTACSRKCSGILGQKIRCGIFPDLTNNVLNEKERVFSGL